MYVCGPTVYNYISIGNARPIIVFNMIRNYLEHAGYSVELVQNITDIEDKIINRANEEGVGFDVITERYIDAFMEDLKGLEISGFAAMPKASEMIPEMISIIEKIIENGYGYTADGDVYFDVQKFSDYGKLSGQRAEEMQSQEEGSFSKRSRIDFTLWKDAKPGEPNWDSPWGKGRPGWHIECSAMAIKYLDYGIDIHGGGIDLVFPHHENEVAQSEAAFPEKGDFVKYWMHNGMIEVREEKMSKSSGLKENWILKNLLKKYSPDVLKMYVLSTHYRSPLEFSIDKLTEAKRSLERISNFLRNVRFLTGSGKDVDTGQFEKDPIAQKIFGYIKRFKTDFNSSMDDDFNSAKAIGNMFDLVKEVNTIIQSTDFINNDTIRESLKLCQQVLIEHGRIFGLGFEKTSHLMDKDKGQQIYLDDSEVEELIKERNNARKKREFKKADEIRLKLKSLGIMLEDRKEGTIWKREE
jgi:cysteinyl-tRNA synthetase